MKVNSFRGGNGVHFRLVSLSIDGNVQNLQRCNERTIYHERESLPKVIEKHGN
jgi:hypothetical protein